MSRYFAGLRRGRREDIPGIGIVLCGVGQAQDREKN
jgi:hypothetical protein